MLRLLFNLFRKDEVTAYGRRLSGGGRVFAFLNGTCSTDISIAFKRRIDERDVKDGKLVPIFIDRVKRRGGKREMCLTLSLDTAEALHEVLESAIKSARPRCAKQQVFGAIASAVNATGCRKFPIRDD